MSVTRTPFEPYSLMSQTKSIRIVTGQSLALLVGLLSCAQLPLVGQTTTDLPEIEKKFESVEIWDEKGRTRANFLREITGLPAGICEQSLVQMGHPDGNKIPLASGKLLLTTRSAPDFRESPTARSLSGMKTQIDPQKWAPLASADLLNTESQLLPSFLPALRAADPAAFDRVFAEKQAEFANYGIQLEATRIHSLYAIYQSGTASLTKPEVLAVLYFSEDPDLIRAAGFILGHFVRTGEDMVDLLPLLLARRPGAQMAIEEFMKGFDGQIDWTNQAEFLPRLLENPNPFSALLVARILDRTCTDRDLIRQAISRGSRTFVEILRSGVLPEEKCLLLSLLNRYSNAPLECNPEDWIDRLQSPQPNLDARD